MLIITYFNDLVNMAVAAYQYSDASDPLDSLKNQEEALVERLNQLESQKKTTIPEDDEVDAQIDSERELLRQIRFQKHLIECEMGAVFPDDQVVATMKKEREQCRYWFDPEKPANVPASFERSSKPVFRTKIEHSVTTDYESDKWAVLNILLETLQNAEPNDSDSTWFTLEIQVGGSWKSWKEIGNYTNSQISAVRVVDNGKGFIPTELGIFGSSKNPDGESGGLFGEGGNMADITARRLGIDVRKHSRNWSATPYLFRQQATGRVVERLGYDTEFYPDFIPGSAVEFRHIGDDFLDAVRTIDEKFLPVRGREYKTLAQTYFGDIVEKKDTDYIFIKGRAYPLVPAPEKPFLFSYNLTKFVVKDRNRSRINLSEALDQIVYILAGNKSKKVVRDLVLAHKEGKTCYELTELKNHLWNLDEGVKDLFGEAICEIYEIPDPKKAFTTMGEGFEPAERFLKEKGGLNAIDIGGSPFLTTIVRERFRSTVDVFNGPEMPGVLFASPSGDILEKGSDIYVNAKLVHVRPALEHPLLYSYNFKNLCETLGSETTDRALNSCLTSMWSKAPAPLVRELIQAYREKKLTHELTKCHPRYWDIRDFPSSQIFHDVVLEEYGISDPNKCFLKTESDEDFAEATLKERGYIPIDMSRSGFLTAFLKNAGFQTARDILDRSLRKFDATVLPEIAARDVPENVLLLGLWQALEKFLHYYGKSGACELDVLIEKENFKDNTKSEEFVPYKKWVAEPTDGKITALRFTLPDLQIHENAFINRETASGEPPCLHALCSFMATHGIQFSIQAGTWVITMQKKITSDPGGPPEPPAVDGINFVYAIADWQDEKSSANTALKISHPSQELCWELSHLKDKVLTLDPSYKPLEQTQYGDLVNVGEGKLYVSGILDDHNYGLLCSYSVSDRSELTPSRVLSSLSNLEAIRKVLRGCSDGKEYKDIKDVCYFEHPQAWREAFHAEFGKRAIIEDKPNFIGAAVAGKYKYSHVKFCNPFDDYLISCADIPSLSSLANVGEYEEVVNVSYNVRELFSFGTSICEWLQKKMVCSGIDAIDFAFDPSRVKVVKKLQNTNGDDLSSLGGIIDPGTRTMFIMETRMQELAEALQAIIRILNDSIADAFPDTMQFSRYKDEIFTKLLSALVKTPVMREVLGKELDTIPLKELRKSLKKFFKKGLEITKEEEQVDTDIGEVMMEERRTIGEWFRDLWGQDEEKSKSEEPMREEKKGKERRAEPGSGEGLDRRNLLRIGRNAAVALVLGSGGLLVARRLNLEGIEIDLPDFFSFLSDDRTVYERPRYPGQYMPDVSPRKAARGVHPHMNFRAWRESVFHSAPNHTGWDGFWMSDFEYHQFDGTRWRHDSKPSQFPQQNFPTQASWMHVQSISSPGEAFIRNQSAGVIDASSIRVVDKEGKEFPFSIRPHEDGYKVAMPRKGAARILYTTKKPDKWESAAARLTDKDYDGLPRKTLDYYLAVPDIDVSQIPFSWKKMPGVKTWKDFFEELKRFKPFHRSQLIHEYVSGREYSNEARTVVAYRNFKKGLTPHKTFIEFLLKSDMLVAPGDGDCDVHNTLNAWIHRMAGIPAKLDLVMDGNHGVANVFFPGIGWTVSDAVGTERRAHYEKLVEELEERQEKNAAYNRCVQKIKK